MAANILYLSLWGKRTLFNMAKMADWLLCHSAVILLKGREGSASVEAELQRGFLASLDLEELRMAAGYLAYGRQLVAVR